MSPVVAIITGEPDHWQQLSGIVSSCGFRPIRCETLAAAGQMLARHRFRAALCEDVLPDGDFRELLRLVKDSGGSRTAVIVVSRMDDWGCFLDAMVAGAFDYVAFPPYAHELERALAAAFAGTATARQAELRAVA